MRRFAPTSIILAVTVGAAASGQWLSPSPVRAAASHRTMATIDPATTAPTTTVPLTTPPPPTTTLAPPAVAPPGPAPSAPPLPAPPGCTPKAVPGGAYALGDSVMIDVQQPLQGCVPGITVNGSVSRQWSDGVAIMRQVMASTPAPAEVVVDLGTNGPIVDGDFDSMMSVLRGATRVVFVTVHVDRPWQDQVNAVLARGVARYPNTVLADWQALAAQHPEWFYTDGTHLPVGGAGAQALAGLMASRL
jgi:hypothetical protein